jgi:hypothetical protein
MKRRLSEQLVNAAPNRSFLTMNHFTHYRKAN